MKSNTLVGLLIIVVGVIFLGNQIDIWDLDVFFDGWWTLFIIVPGIVSLLKGEIKGALITIIIGVFLLLASNDVLNWSLIWPIVIILIGFSVLFGNKPNTKNIKNSDYLAVFSGSSNTVNDTLENLNITSVFGSVDLDLRKATIKEDVTITCTCLFAGIEILVPEDVVVKVKGTPIFGGIDNTTTASKGKVITIDCICAFGGIDIK